MSYSGPRVYHIWSPETGQYSGWKFDPAYIKYFNSLDWIDKSVEIARLKARKAGNPQYPLFHLHKRSHVVSDYDRRAWTNYINRNPISFLSYRRRKGGYKRYF